MSANDLKDSGQRQEFSTGAVRDTAGNKPLLGLLPSWSLLAYGWIMEAGARKYSARNWEKGMGISRYIESAKRHLEAYQMGFRDEPHLWQALWNVGGAVHTQILVYIGVYPAELYDLPNHVGKEPIPILGEFEKTRVDAMMQSSKDKNPQRPLTSKKHNFGCTSDLCLRAGCRAETGDITECMGEPFSWEK